MRHTTPRKREKTPTRRARLAAQQAAAEEHRAWHHDRADAAEERAYQARKARQEAGPTGGRLRALARLAEALGGETPVTRRAVQQLERDRRGRQVPHRNLDRDRSLRGKARIRARKAARR